MWRALVWILVALALVLWSGACPAPHLLLAGPGGTLAEPQPWPRWLAEGSLPAWVAAWMTETAYRGATNGPAASMRTHLAGWLPCRLRARWRLETWSSPF